MTDNLGNIVSQTPKTVAKPAEKPVPPKVSTTGQIIVAK
jgi:hypothetical protein